MHFVALVLIPPDGDVRQHVGRLMAPYEEEPPQGSPFLAWVTAPDFEKGGYMGNPNGQWDWYQIGGRWTGELTDYEPEKDPRNLESCHLCHATGTRRDMIVPNGCNGCRGEGIRTKWPTDWAPHPGDIQPARVAIDKEFIPYALVAEGSFEMKERWDRTAPGRHGLGAFVPTPNWEERVRKALWRHATSNGRVVVVDCHS